MDRAALHLEIRNALELADELGRHEHARGDDDLAAQLAALETALFELERAVGRDHHGDAVPRREPVETVERTIGELTVQRGYLPRSLRARMGVLLASLERLAWGLSRPSEQPPSKPLFGALPLARVIPQDAHAVLDYLCAAAYLASARTAHTPLGRAVGRALAVSVAGVSLATDYRLSVTKRVPIEVHEGLDHAAGLTAALSPFLLGYARKDPIAAAIQLTVGIGQVFASLLTDYRASKGVTAPRRSRGGPAAVHGRASAVRVPPAQRALEGFSSAPTDWRPDAPGWSGEIG